MFALPPQPVIDFSVAASTAYFNQQLPCSPVTQFLNFDDSIYPFGAGAVTNTVTCTITFNTKYPFQGSDGSWIMFCAMMAHEIGHILGYPDENTDPYNIEYYGPGGYLPVIPNQCYGSLTAPPHKSHRKRLDRARRPARIHSVVIPK